MSYQPCDVYVQPGWPGHVGMVYSNDELVHATSKTGVAHASLFNQLGGDAIANATVYRAPWKDRGDAAAKRQEVLANADAIMASARYGAYRAARLWVGRSIFGSDATKRLNRYRTRKQAGYQDPHGKDKFVTTVSCVELVVLSYQLAFDDGDAPFFIRLDAAHSMPSTLRQWLAAHWEQV